MLFVAVIGISGLLHYTFIENLQTICCFTAELHLIEQFRLTVCLNFLFLFFAFLNVNVVVSVPTVGGGERL